MSNHPDPPADVRAAIAAMPDAHQAGLWALRDLILDVAATLPEVGTVTECLKWGQPAFTTPQTKSGTTLRIGCPKSGGYALYAHCQTQVISTFVERFGTPDDRIEGNRAVHFSRVSDIDPDRHGALIAHALTYHL